TRNQRIETAERFRPFQRVEIIFHAEHGRRVDSFADENALDQLAALGHAENLRQRPCRLVAFQPLDSPRAEDQDAMRALAAQHLLPGEGDDIEFREIETLRESRRSGIAESEALAVSRNEISVWHARARCGAVPGEDHVAVEIDLAEIDNLAVRRFEGAYIFELELLGHVRHP